MNRTANHLAKRPHRTRSSRHLPLVVGGATRAECARPRSTTGSAALLFGLTVWLGGALATSPTLATDAPTFDHRLEAANQFMRGKALVEATSFEEARRAYLAAIELDDDPYIRLELAQLLVDLANNASSRDARFARLGEAASHASVARDAAPNNPDILRLYGQINLSLAEVQSAAVEQAEEAYVALRELVEGDIQGLVSLAQIYLWKRQFSQAADVLREAASYRAEHPVIRRMLLEALLGSNALDEAEPLLRELVEAEPRALDQRMTLAEVYNRRGDAARALAVLEATPPEMRDEPRVRDAMVAALHRAGEHERAREALGRLIVDLGANEDRLRLRISILNALARYNEAIGAIDAWKPATPEDQVERVLLRSRLLERVGRASEALASLRTQLEQAPPGTRIRIELELAGVLERDDQADQAIDGLRQFIDGARGGSRVLAVQALADVLHRAGRTSEAIELLDGTAASISNQGAIQRLVLRKLALLTAAENWGALIDQGPELMASPVSEVRFAARVAHGEALARAGRLDDALGVLATEADDAESTAETRRQALGRGIALRLREGREAEARRLLGEVTDEAGVENLFFAAQLWRQAERYDEAIPLLEAILEEEPESPQALFGLATAHERSGDFERASEVFRRLLAAVPDHAPSLNYLGYMLAERGEKLIEALTMIRRAVAIDPDNGAYADSLGWAYFRLGKLDQARRHLEWAARLIDDDPTVHEHLGDLYTALDLTEQARRSYREALALDAEDPDQVERKLEALDG